jgi:Arc/MetJ-type ribon-helix-helix transcriptional regulator
MISLRLSDEEFEALRSLYTTHGARSVSEFVRDAMQRLIAEPGTGNVSLEVKVQEMDGKLHLLDDNVARLSRLIQSEPAPSQGGLSESD